MRQKEKTKGAEPNKAIKKQKMDEAGTKKGKRKRLLLIGAFVVEE
ncbi:hypothetical protein Hanom_Chr09g00859491 [Helianthus anomalus]